MRVIVHSKKFYDWKPVPADVKVTPADIKSGRVKPNANDDGYSMRITRDAPNGSTHTTCCITEELIARRIIHEAMPNQGSQTFSRKEAVGQILAVQLMPNHAHPKHMTGFEVDSDDGPDEQLFRSLLEPHTKALHEQSGEPLVDPSEVEARVQRYLEPASKDDHVKHLHARFNVPVGGGK